MTRITTLMWHDQQAAADLFAEERLGVRKLRRATEIMARSHAQLQPPGNDFAVLTDDRAHYTDQELRFVDIGEFVVNLAAKGHSNGGVKL